MNPGPCLIKRSGENQCESRKGQCGKCEPGRAEAYSTIQTKIRLYLSDEQQEIGRNYILK